MGRGAALGPVEMTGADFWVSIPALGGAGAFQQREPPKTPFALVRGLVSSPLFALRTSDRF